MKSQTLLAFAIGLVLGIALFGLVSIREVTRMQTELESLTARWQSWSEAYEEMYDRHHEAWLEGLARYNPRLAAQLRSEWSKTP